MNEDRLQLILDHLINYVIKKGDAPMSAELHFCQAFTQLMVMQPDWEPADQESEDFVDYAKALMNKSGFKP